MLTRREWIKDGTSTRKTTIDDNGVWELADSSNLWSLGAASVFVVYKSSEPAGAVVQCGLRCVDGDTPTYVSGAAITVPTLASIKSIGLPVRVVPQGRLCVVVSGFVNGFGIEVLQ